MLLKLSLSSLMGLLLQTPVFANPVPGNGPEGQPGTGQVGFGLLFAEIFSTEVFGTPVACDGHMDGDYWAGKSKVLLDRIVK